MGIEIRHKVRVGDKIVAVFKRTGADISHRVVCSPDMHWNEGGSLTGALTERKETEEAGGGEGRGRASLLGPRHGRSII